MDNTAQTASLFVSVTVNGQPVKWPYDSARCTTLLDALRQQGIPQHPTQLVRPLTGTKEGCAEGDCGACTVLVNGVDHQGVAQWQAINSCIAFLPTMDQKHVITVEGLQNIVSHPHPVQQRMVTCAGSQCGYCTPGFIMSMTDASMRHAHNIHDVDAVMDTLAGNLCRCTGYKPIKDAMLKTLHDSAPSIPTLRAHCPRYA